MAKPKPRSPREIPAIERIEHLERAVADLAAALKLGDAGGNESARPPRRPLGKIDRAIFELLCEVPEYQALTANEITDRLFKKHLIALDVRDLRRRHYARLEAWGMIRAGRLGVWVPPENRPTKS